MKKQMTNYTIVIEKDTRTGTDEDCYTAYVPVLGIAADGDTPDVAQQEARDLIEFHLQSLQDEGEDLPLEDDNSIAVRTEVVLPEQTAITT